MKLEYWMEDEDLDEYADYEGYGYHVIKTCGECKYFDERKDFGYCESSKNNFLNDEFKKNFGCIHFEQKKNENKTNTSTD